MNRNRSSILFFFSSRRRHTRLTCDWSSDVCSSDLSAWKEVGIRISGVRSLAGTTARARRPQIAATSNGREEDPAEVARRIEQLTGQLATLSKEVAHLKSKPH